jgi:Fe-coproporphyrin III synthase
VVTLYVTERCNSRCVTCDYWRHGRTDLSAASVLKLLPGLKRLDTRIVALSGGEPLLNPEWASIARLLKSQGHEVWLLTSGLALAKHARRLAGLFDAVTVSMDGVDPATYAAIRGLDAFDKVCEGVRLAAREVPVGLRVTLQRLNFRQLPQFVALAKQLSVRQVSFLAVDVANTHAFGRTGSVGNDPALYPEELDELGGILTSLEQDHAEDFDSGFIAENPEKLRRILGYFSAVRGRGPYPRVRCNAPEFSAVIDAHSRVQPCFFISGPASQSTGIDLITQLDSDPMEALRLEIREGRRPECKACVCSMWREPAAAHPGEYLS